MSTLNENKNLLKLAGYELIKKIGQGTFSKVYLTAQSKKNNMYYLACIIIDTKILDQKYNSKFLQREIQILSKIRHPHITHRYT